MNFRDQVQWQLMLDRLHIDEQCAHPVRRGTRSETGWGPRTLGIAGPLFLLASVPMFSVALLAAGTMMVLAASLWQDWLEPGAGPAPGSGLRTGARRC